MVILVIFNSFNVVKNLKKPDLIAHQKLPFYTTRNHSHIESSHSLCQNDPKLQTHPPIIVKVKMPNLLKVNVYNFKCKISLGNTMKLFFLSHKCINKSVHKLEHK